MKTTLEIPDELYRQAKIKAAHENRKMKDLVSDALRLIIALPAQKSGLTRRRMTQAPVKISKGNVLPVLSNDAMAELLERAGERLP